MPHKLLAETEVVIKSEEQNKIRLETQLETLEIKFFYLFKFCTKND